MTDILKMSAFLVVVCALTAGALALTDGVTKDRIAANKAKVEEEARKAVLGDVAFEKSSARKAVLGGAELEIFEYFDAAGRKVALAAKGTGKGFGGKIEFMLGIDPEGRILGVKVVSHTETPGLGTKVMADDFLGQFRGLSAAEAALRREDPSGRVDAITGVTVSTRAISGGIRKLLDLMKDEFDG